jgi:hypothetical protein
MLALIGVVALMVVSYAVGKTKGAEGHIVASDPKAAEYIAWLEDKLAEAREELEDLQSFNDEDI